MSQTACPTSGAAFSLVATGSALSYHWQVESPANSGLYTDLSALPGPTFTEPSTGLTFDFAGASTDTLSVSKSHPRRATPPPSA